MRYFLDCEFNEFGGELLSLALVREDGESLYLVFEPTEEPGPWVRENVVPLMMLVPDDVEVVMCLRSEAPRLIARFLAADLRDPYIVTDWPDDIRYFCAAIITGPGEMAAIPRLTFDMVRVNAYPTTLEGAVQHNAWWDAMALRHLLQMSGE